MELKTFLKTFLKFWQFLAALTILGGVGGLIFSQFQVPKFATEVLFYFEPKEVRLVQSANEFTDTILGILATGGFEGIEIRKIAPQLLQFKILARNQKDVEMAASNLEKNLELNLGKILGSEKVSVIPVTEKLQIDKPENFLILNILVGVALGFVAAAAAVSTFIYFRM